ncbi:putative nuclease HARBI1 [Aphis craccivora]|uniref:Putative nuclease HARBI1 n=1 Tax=Aphis craccivora TaxID=307492 RepID=A0A6G0Y5J0_APHCR|nr:putative nuclease HARBI1 [Aphis craccivora]
MDDKLQTAKARNGRSNSELPGSPKEMVVPTTQDWLDISEAFFSKTQFPNCVGTVDRKHIRLECPPSNGTLYYNY